MTGNFVFIVLSCRRQQQRRKILVAILMPYVRYLLSVRRDSAAFAIA